MDCNINKMEIWNRFVRRMGIAEEAVPLFDVDANLFVKTKEIGSSNKRLILTRSDQMNIMIKNEVRLVVEDWERRANEYDGLIYMMLKKEKDNIIPLYIGKAETFGKGDGNLSANIKGIPMDTSKFARWGDNYAYHIGDLSAVVLPGHADSYRTKKYSDWASAIFSEYQTIKPKLKEDVFFWMKSWKSSYIGIWDEFGATKLTFLEYLLIGLASSLFPNDLLNREGRNR